MTFNQVVRGSNPRTLMCEKQRRSNLLTDSAVFLLFKRRIVIVLSAFLINMVLSVLYNYEYYNIKIKELKVVGMENLDAQGYNAYNIRTNKKGVAIKYPFYQV